MRGMTIGSKTAILDVGAGRRELRHLIEPERTGQPGRLPVVITGVISGVWGNDDGISQEFQVDVQDVSERNPYDPAKDRIRREGALIAGPLKLACYRVRDPISGEFGPRQFHATYGDTVMAVMGEEAAKLFARFVCGNLGIEFGGAVPPTDAAFSMGATDETGA